MPASRVNVRQLQAPIKARYEENPDAARITCSARSGASDLADPLHCTVVSESVPEISWPSGAHPGVGGDGDVACSGDLLMAALVACQETTVRMVAAAMGIEIEKLEVRATATADLRGTLAMSREVAVGLSAVNCEVLVEVRDDGRGLRAQRLLENAEKYCIVLNTLREGVEVRTDFQVSSVPLPAS